MARHSRPRVHSGESDNIDGSDQFAAIPGFERLQDWDWPSRAAREHARELVLAVSAAEAAARRGTDDGLYENQESRGRWEVAVHRAARLRALAPPPYPGIVAEALAAADAAQSLEVLTDDAGETY